MVVETMGDWLQLYNIGLTGLNGLSAPDSGLRSPVLRSPWVGPIPILVNTGSVKKKDSVDTFKTLPPTIS